MKNTTVNSNDTVTCHYVGTLDNGDVFDSSRVEGREPFTVTLGENALIPGFESAIVGLNIGDTKTFSIEVDEAYGPREEDLIVSVPMDRLPEGVEEGFTLQMMTPQGPALATVASINEDRTVAQIDHNHPLAGQRLTFEVEILDTVSTEVINN
jgi:peptidylprolyl isomerase